METFYEYYFYVTTAAAVATLLATYTKTKKDDAFMVKVNKFLASVASVFKPKK